MRTVLIAIVAFIAVLAGFMGIAMLAQKDE